MEQTDDQPNGGTREDKQSVFDQSINIRLCVAPRCGVVGRDPTLDPLAGRGTLAWDWRLGCLVVLHFES